MRTLRIHMYGDVLEKDINNSNLIDILVTVKNDMAKGRYHFICPAIKARIKEKLGISCDYIPSASIFGENGIFPDAHKWAYNNIGNMIGGVYGAWWYKGDVSSRFKLLDHLIKELKKESNDELD